MPSVQSSLAKVSEAAPALPAVDRAWAERVAHRLRETFAAVIGKLPAGLQRATPLARGVGLNVPLCHRILSGAKSSPGPVEVFGAFPGPDGLTMFLRALEAKGLIDVGAMSDASGAVAEYAELITGSGGSQRRFLAALHGSVGSQHVGGRESRNAEESRRRLFEASVEQLGCRAEAMVGVRVYTPAKQPRGAGDLDATGAVGRLGFERSTASMPYITMFRASAPEQLEQGEAALLMEEFCTKPLPPVVMHDFVSQRVGVVDPSFERSGAMDIFAGPLTRRNIVEYDGESMFINAGTQCSSPAAELLTDVYLPAEWASGADCSAALYREDALGAVIGDPAKRWFDRLPMALLPLLIGRGLEHAKAECHPRHELLTRRVFEHAGADPAGYVGFRLHVRYPLPNMHYLCLRRSRLV